MNRLQPVCRIVCMAAMVVILGLTGACSRKDGAADADKPVTIWWAQWAPADGLQQLADEYQKETGTPVKVHQIPWSNYQDKVFLEFGNSPTEFDIVVGDSQWIGRGATKGLYLELTDWLPQAVDVGTIHPRALKYLCEFPTGSGKYFAAPCETDAVGFAYRRDWFEDPQEREAFKAEYGRELVPPETWEEFRDIAEFFTRPDEKRFGCALLTGRGYDSLTMGFQQIMWAFGGNWGDPTTFTADGHVNSPGAVKALEFMKSLLAFAPKGGENYDYGKTMEAFTNGSTAMVMDYFAFYPSMMEQMGDKAGFFMVPMEGDVRVISLGGQGFSISAKIPSIRRQKAKDFIAWFLKTENQKKWITKPAGFTANTDVLKSPEFRSATPYNAPFADSLEFLRDFWNVPAYNELLAEAQKYVGEALDGARTPQDALNELAKAHERVFAAEGLRK
ncbi:MAG: sugar ABC transporter substrate-binding protein [Planctomycetes bacterium]|nr:sugar ABC transporter substrate-binding protein [Planctomycetota bacterium]